MSPTLIKTTHSILAKGRPLCELDKTSSTCRVHSRPELVELVWLDHATGRRLASILPSAASRGPGRWLEFAAPSKTSPSWPPVQLTTSTNWNQSASGKRPATSGLPNDSSSSSDNDHDYDNRDANFSRASLTCVARNSLGYSRECRASSDYVDFGAGSAQIAATATGALDHQWSQLQLLRQRQQNETSASGECRAFD